MFAVSAEVPQSRQLRRVWGCFRDGSCGRFVGKAEAAQKKNSSRMAVTKW